MTAPQPHIDALASIPEIHDVSTPEPAAPCPVELAKMWDIFHIDPDGPIALRAIKPKGSPFSLPAMNVTFTATDFPDVEDRKQAFSASAFGFNNDGYNIYIVMNPIDRGFAGNLSNKVAVKDDHIACRRLLLIDLDRTSKLVAPANDDEVQEATEVADRMAAFFKATYDAEVFRVMSGNGEHLYVPLPDFSNDAKAKQDCQGLLKGFALRFDTPTIKVDRGVFNASRITKVPGTIARKGAATPERPFRMAFVK